MRLLTWIRTTHLTGRLATPGLAPQLHLVPLHRLQVLSLGEDLRLLRWHEDRESGVPGPDWCHALGRAHLALEPPVVLQRDGVDVQGIVSLKERRKAKQLKRASWERVVDFFSKLGYISLYILGLLFPCNLIKGYPRWSCKANLHDVIQILSIATM